MNVTGALSDFKTRLDPKIAAYFDKALAEARKEDPLIVEALEHVRTLTLSGGKRLRPAFMYYGYLAAGGNDRERLIDASLSVELIHIFLLIHDDIIDRDEIRHGVTTLHKKYADWGAKSLSIKNPEHFGNSIALIVGDMLFAMGNDVIFRSGFPEKAIFAALSTLQRIVSYTVVGQAKDIYMEYKGEAEEEEILKMYENKTARYTIEGPLHLGALLAGGSKELLETFTRYALPLGVAFQIQDDILGVFGTSERTGKPVGSDIEEGKLTLLVSQALKAGTPSEQRAIRRILSLHERLAENDIDEFRNIMQNSGSLEFAKETAAKRIAEGKAALLASAAPIAPEAKDFLVSVADYLAEREY